MELLLQNGRSLMRKGQLGDAVQPWSDSSIQLLGQAEVLLLVPPLLPQYPGQNSPLGSVRWQTALCLCSMLV